MTPVVTLQRRFRELGRVRMGQQIPTGKTRKDGTPITRPSALKQWRLTSYGEQGRELLQQAAKIYGGEPREWQHGPDSGWELLTESDSLAFLVPPVTEPFSVWLEKWTAAGCERRCDGERAQVYGGRGRGWRHGRCRCEDPTNPEKRECSIVLRFGIILPDVDGLGIWQFQTHSFHGAEELQGALAILGARAMQGIVTPAKLRIEPREIRRPAMNDRGETKVEVSKFVVPVIDVQQSIGQLMSGEGERLALPSSGRMPEGRPALPSARPALPAAPVVVDTAPPSADGPPPPGPADLPELGEEFPPVPEGEEAARGVEEGEIVDEGGGMSAEEISGTLAGWRKLGFTDDEIQKTVYAVTGRASVDGLTLSEGWLVEGELRAEAGRRSSS